MPNSYKACLLTFKAKDNKNASKLLILAAALLSIFIVSIIPVHAKIPRFSNHELLVPPPRIIRTCCSFGSNLSISGIPFVKVTDITSRNEIGRHHYLGDKHEGNGNIYTRRGGFIDIGHLRDCADWTAYLYHLILTTQNTGGSFTLDLGTEGGSKTLTLTIPADLDSLSACKLAGKIAYDLSLWHEIATWFGSSYIPLIPERYSSFSPEDLYSNLLGVNLGMQALQSEMEYDEAMTLLISNILDSLETVSTEEETYTAMEEVENIWWTREKNLPNKKILLKWYIDLGLSSCLTPWLVPGEESTQPVYKIYKPEVNFSDLYVLSIKLNYKFPIRSIFISVDDRIVTQNDFGLFIEYIKQDMVSLQDKMAIRSEKLKNKNLIIEN